MTIVEALKKLIIERGGSTAGVHTIADAVKELSEIESEADDEDKIVGTNSIPNEVG